MLVLLGSMSSWRRSSRVQRLESSVSKLFGVKIYGYKGLEGAYKLHGNSLIDCPLAQDLTLVLLMI